MRTIAIPATREALRVLFTLCILCAPGMLQAQKTTQQTADEYKKKIRETSNPKEKMRLAKELQDILVPKPYQDGSISATQVSSMHDRKYRVRIQCSSNDHSSSVSNGPCPGNGMDDGRNSLQGDFVIVMHRNYSAYTAAGFGAALEYFSASGSGSTNSVSKSCTGSRTCITTTAVDLNADASRRIFNFFYNANDQTWEYSFEVPSSSRTECRGQDEGTNIDGDSYLFSCNSSSEGFHCTEKDGSFVIEGQHTFNDKDSEAGRESMSSVRMRVELVPYSEMKYDAYIVPINTGSDKKTTADFYSKWVPQGRTKTQSANDYGNSISFRIKIVEREHPEKELGAMPFQVRWKLDSVSTHAGDCLNFPLQSTDNSPDLRFDTSASLLPNGMQKRTTTELLSGVDNGSACMASVLCTDYAACGLLRAHVTMVDNSRSYELDAHLPSSTVNDLPIPCDENHNCIADQWEKDKGVFTMLVGPQWDDEHQPGNDNNGDGLTLFEEYRGAFVQGAHKRLSPFQKELFVVNNSAVLKDQQLDELEKLSGADRGIKVLVLRKDELPTNLHVNANRTSFSGGAQCGVRIEDKAGTAASAGAFGKAVAKGGDNAPLHSPKDLDYIWLCMAAVSEEAPFIKNINGFIAHTALHEVAHALGVPHHNGDASIAYRPLSDIGRFNDNNCVVYDQRTKKQSSWSDIVNDAQTHWNAYDMHITHATEACGDVNCIMCYNSIVSYAVYPARYTGTDSRKISLIIRNGLKDEIRTRFCNEETSAGTEWNAPDNSFSVNVDGNEYTETLQTFGKPSEGGNCMKYFKVKDW